MFYGNNKQIQPKEKQFLSQSEKNKQKKKREGIKYALGFRETQLL